MKVNPMRNECGARTRAGRAMPRAEGRWKDPLPNAWRRGRKRRAIESGMEIGRHGRLPRQSIARGAKPRRRLLRSARDALRLCQKTAMNDPMLSFRACRTCRQE